jgi:hypothetical protein
MPWVRFISDFNWKPKPAVTIAYKAGHVMNVTSACAAEAVRKGRATRMKKTTKSAIPIDAVQSED